MEPNKKRPEWWEDPVSNWRSKLADLTNRPNSNETNRSRPLLPQKKVFFKKVRRSKIE